jgi:hypothetical protein
MDEPQLTLNRETGKSACVIALVIALAVAIGGGLVAGIALVAVGLLNPLYFVNMVLHLATIPFGWGLWKGRHKAWLCLQAMLGVNLAAAAVVGVFQPALLPAAFIECVVCIVLWAWLWEEPVRAYCAVPSAARWQDVKLVCRKCGAPAAPGPATCPECGGSLRPLLLDTTTLAGVAILLALIGMANWFSVEMPRWKAGFFGRLIYLPDKLPDTIGAVALYAAGITAIYFLRAGRYHAWVAVQVLGVLGIVLAFGQAAAALNFDPKGHANLWFDTNPFLVTRALIETFLVVVFLVCIYRARIRAFCRVGAEAGDEPRA